MAANPTPQLSGKLFLNHFAPLPNSTLEYWLRNPTPKRHTDRKWEDLDTDCLVNIFQKVGVESMLLFIPFVCKSWHRTSLTPACWKSLLFPYAETFDPMNFDTADSNESEAGFFDFFVRRFAREFDIAWSDFTIPKFFKLLIRRSQGSVEFLKLPGGVFSVYTFALRQILHQINRHCRKFTGLHVADACIGAREAALIVRFLPKLKYLCLKRARINRNNLITILRACKDLEVLDVRGCTGFDEGDEEILALASHIPKFMCAGSHSNVPVEVIEIIDDEEDQGEGQEEDQEEVQGEGQGEDQGEGQEEGQGEVQEEGGQEEVQE